MTTGEKMIWAMVANQGKLVEPVNVALKVEAACEAVLQFRHAADNDKLPVSKAALAMLREMVAPDADPLAKVREHVRGPIGADWLTKLQALVGA